MKRTLKTSLITRLALAVVFMAGIAGAQSGSLVPPSTALDGSGNPQPTTQTQPSLDQSLPVVERFILVLGGAAVLDKNTGLVWQQSPDSSSQDWETALFACANKNTGGKKGWRLPSVQEMASLLQPDLILPSLPSGHLFSNIGLGSTRWSMTTDAVDSTKAWDVDFGNGSVGVSAKIDNGTSWCVRGGGLVSEY